jgi:hypothetical protein
MLRPLTLAAFLGACVASPAAATDVDAMIGLLAGMGHAVVEADEGNPTLHVDGRSWYMGLQCTGRAGCEYAWIHAPRKLDHPVYADCANDWNGQEVFTTAWIDNVSQPWLTASIDFAGDPGPASIRSQIERFKSQLVRFEAYIETCPPILKGDL